MRMQHNRRQERVHRRRRPPPYMQERTTKAGSAGFKQGKQGSALTSKSNGSSKSYLVVMTLSQVVADGSGPARTLAMSTARAPRRPMLGLAPKNSDETYGYSAKTPTSSKMTEGLCRK